MLRATAKNIKREIGRVKYVNIVRDATELGVDRTHLYRVLAGKRTSKTLLRRYRQLKEAA